MFDSSWLWVVFTLLAAAAQTIRNATQRELTATLGTAGATQVRFLFGLPFALVFLAVIVGVTGGTLPRPELVYWPWVLLGALSQIAATALMLAAMGERSFVVAYAYIKTEPVQVAMFGFVFLGDVITFPMLTAIVIATGGVILMGLRPGVAIGAGGLRATLLGIAAGAMFGLSAVGFRGALLNLNEPNYFIAASLTVAVGIAVQAGLLTLYLALFDRKVLTPIIGQWKPSMLAGFLGALASQFWFLAFALATAASVRTLALVEVLFAQAISFFVFKQNTTPREAIGIVMVVAGVVLLIRAH